MQRVAKIDRSVHSSPVVINVREKLVCSFQVDDCLLVQTEAYGVEADLYTRESDALGMTGSLGGFQRCGRLCNRPIVDAHFVLDT